MKLRILLSILITIIIYIVFRRFPLITILLLIQFIPTLIAKSRRHPNIIPIMLTSFFPILGWFIALIWSFTVYHVDN